MSQLILDAIPAKVALLTPSGVISAMNRGWVSFCKVNSIECAVGSLYMTVCEKFIEENPETIKEAEEALNGVISGKSENTTFRYFRHINDQQRWFRVRVAPYKTDAGLGAIVMHFDVTESVLAEQKLFELAHFDTLTGLPNRVFFIDRIERAISSADRHGWKLAVVFADLDRFKDINDTLGHSAGDQLLKQFGERLSGCVRKGDSVCRFGGDEFALILTEMSEAGDAGLVSRKLINAMKQPFQLGDREVFGSASLGISVYPDDAHDPETLLSHADTAMYRTKQAGRTSFQFYTAAMNKDAMERLQLESDLRLALERDEFELYYQPKVSCFSGGIVGAEALIRWHHPKRGIVSPADFIPVLEELRLINDVGAWTLSDACRQIRLWLDEGIDPPVIAVNLSARQLDGDDLVMTVRQALEDYRISPDLLELELTEGLLMRNVERVVPILAELRGIGVSLAVDDFGTGYSSLAYLKQFPLDAVKVDRSFVRDITADADDASITRAVINMAHQLKLKVIAEGVETEGQLALLIANQCDEIQGYFFSRPVPAVEMATMLRENRCLPPDLLRLDDRQRTILIVDDESNVISSLRRLLRPDGYRILSANSGHKGLELLAKNKVDVIISDQRMPEMTGVEFLRRVKSIYPETVRIVLSGYTDLQSITEAVNEGSIYRFMTKPWDDNLLRKNIAGALRHKELAEENHRLGINLQMANVELARSNQQLHEVIEAKQRRIVRDETTLNIAQKLLYQLPIPIVGADDDGLIVFANEQAVEILGQGKALLGLSAQRILPIPLLKLLELPNGHQESWTNGAQDYLVHCQPLLGNEGNNSRLLMLVPKGVVSHV